MANDLVQPSDLTDFPGAPFSQAILDAVAAALVDELGWHVTPEITETATFDFDGGSRLVLPSRKVVSVAEVRDVSDETPEEIVGWRLSQAGILAHSSWPVGYSVIEVDMTHGYAITPPALLPVIADLAKVATLDKTVAQQSAQPYQVMYLDAGKVEAWAASHEDTLTRYRARTDL